MSDEMNYFINNPVFVKYKNRMSFFPSTQSQYLKSVYVNERIIEIPYAIEGVSRLPKGSKILDLGCMESLLPLFLSGLGYKVTGLDFRHYPYTHPNFHFVKGDILNLPFEKEEYTAVLSISTIEHIGLGSYKDPLSNDRADLKAIKEIFRVLKKGGILILTVPFGRPHVDHHQRIYDKEFLQELLKGFRVEEERFFRNTHRQDERCNFWQEVLLDEAATIDSQGKADGVCLIKAYKP